jgi:nucleoid DNA-binding protein
VLKNFFDQIIRLCGDGEEVRIRNFGVFYTRLIKGRKITTPVLSEGAMNFKDTIALKFRQSPNAKKKLNQTGETK